MKLSDNGIKLIKGFEGLRLTAYRDTAGVWTIGYGSTRYHDGKPVKQRTVVVIPGRQPELDPNKTMRVSILIDGFTDEDDRANIKMEVTGFILR